MILHKICPLWKRHVLETWNFYTIKTYWFCKRCPITRFSSIGKAYRRTIGEE